MFYVNCGRTDWNPADFLRTGREEVDGILEWVADRTSRDAALDIGCGLGRLCVPLAEEFGRVDGVDFSDRMLDQARAMNPPPNITFHLLSEPDLTRVGSAAYDLALSLHVFQHISEAVVIERYMETLAAALKPGGVAVLHFDTRHVPRRRRLVLALPDAVLPRVNRRHMRRHPRDADWVRGVVWRAGLVLEDEQHAGTSSHRLLLRRGA